MGIPSGPPMPILSGPAVGYPHPVLRGPMMPSAPSPNAMYSPDYGSYGTMYPHPAQMYEPPTGPGSYYGAPGNYPYNPSTHFFDYMKGPSYPSEIQASAEKVRQYLRTHNFNADVVGPYLNSFQHLNTEDQIVAFLLLIQRDLPLDCKVKADISQLILYNMMRSYVGFIPQLQNLFPSNFGTHYGQGQSIYEYREIIKYLLNKLRCCEKHRASSRAGAEAKYITQTPPPPEIRYLPAPTPEPQVITRIEYVEKPCPTLPPPPAPTEPPFSQLIPAIPTPNNPFEKTKYKTLMNFMNRADVNDMVGHLEFTAGMSEEEKLKMFLDKAVQLDLEQPVIDAIKYYINYSKKMGALNLFTQKEIRKQFELTKIFTDVFDFEMLSVEGKLAFDAFYNFLLGVTGDQMTNFSTWTEVKTKGEFMQVLFAYFIEQSFTPENIKEAIIYLKPLVLMDGEGATPL